MQTQLQAWGSALSSSCEPQTGHKQPKLISPPQTSLVAALFKKPSRQCNRRYGAKHIDTHTCRWLTLQPHHKLIGRGRSLLRFVTLPSKAHAHSKQYLATATKGNKDTKHKVWQAHCALS